MNLQDLESKDFIIQIGKTIKNLRNEKNLSLEELSKKTGISRLTLSKIEKGTANSTLNILWKICASLEVEFAQLFDINDDVSISKANTSLGIEDENKSFRIELMFKQNHAKSMEFYRIYLSENKMMLTEEHNRGCIESVIVMQGKIELLVDDKTYILNQFDSIKFKADTKHSYKNISDDTSIINTTLIYN